MLKAPGHLFSLGALLRRYPNARIVQTHRDPLRVMASMASHATVLRRAFSDDADPREIAADWTDRWARALDDFLAVRERANPAQFLDVAYESIECAPLETIERVYDFLGWPLADSGRAAIERFLAANPKDKHGAHRYTLEQYGLDPAALTRRFARLLRALRHSGSNRVLTPYRSAAGYGRCQRAVTALRNASGESMPRNGSMPAPVPRITTSP